MKKNILVVDDEAELGELTCLMLENFGYTTFFATNAEEGLESIKSHDINLILTDYRMSGMTGVEMLKEALNQNLKLPPSIIVSAFSGKSLESDEYKELRIINTMEKPFMESELKEIVAEALK